MFFTQTSCKRDVSSSWERAAGIAKLFLSINGLTKGSWGVSTKCDASGLWASHGWAGGEVAEQTLWADAWRPVQSKEVTKSKMMAKATLLLLLD